jgi:hypothetical protein
VHQTARMDVSHCRRQLDEHRDEDVLGYCDLNCRIRIESRKRYAIIQNYHLNTVPEQVRIHQCQCEKSQLDTFLSTAVESFCPSKPCTTVSYTYTELSFKIKNGAELNIFGTLHTHTHTHTTLIYNSPRQRRRGRQRVLLDTHTHTYTHIHTHTHTHTRTHTHR